MVPFIWFAVTFIAYGITYSIGNFPGSIYTNGYLTALAHVVPYYWANGEWLGRKKSMILGFFISGLASLLLNPSAL